jgi:O-antigen/teichoic acid export membrane protein
VKTFVRNSLSRLASQGAGKISLFFWTLILARRLNPDGFGAYVYIVAMAGMIGIVSDYGLGNLTTREVARQPLEAGRYLTHTHLLRALLAAGAYALFIGAVLVLPGFRGVAPAAVLFGLTIFTVSIINGFNAVLNAREELQWSSFMTALVPLLTLAAGFAFLSLGWGLTGAAVATVAAGAAVLCAEFALFRSKQIRFTLPVDAAFTRNLVRNGFPFFLVSILSAVIVSLDSVLLEALKGKAAVGMYSASFRLILSLMILPAAIGDAAFPVWSRESRGNAKPKRLSPKKMLWSLSAAGAAVAVALSVAAAPLVQIVFGAKFAPAVPVLRVHGWALVFMYLSAPLMVRLMVADRLKEVAVTFGVVAAVNTIFNLAVIPRYGIVGAAAVRLFTEALNFLMLGFYTRRWETMPGRPAIDEAAERESGARRLHAGGTS